MARPPGRRRRSLAVLAAIGLCLCLSACLGRRAAARAASVRSTAIQSADANPAASCLGPIVPARAELVCRSHRRLPAPQPTSALPGQNFPTFPIARFRSPPRPRFCPPGFRPWWQAEVTHPFQPQTALVPVAPTGLVLAALAHSAQIRALNESVFISQSTITEAEGKFDPRAFAESRLVADSDPTGNTLTTGGPDPWIDTHWYGSAGIRKQGLSGAQLEVSQQIGYEDSNSLYFSPTHQGTARLAITLTQPLLNGAGAAYNGSVMVLANINTEIARDRFSRDLQALLLDLHRNYWDLYLQRSALAQRTRLYRQAVVIRDELKARQALDATARPTHPRRSRGGQPRGRVDPLPRGRSATPRPASVPW